ncbi:MAG: hypothetical protein K6E30_03530 [Lachnospiraceae bacterium]|nr:hypothetical protein [Lachnospiraceae bacterium]
MSDRFSEVFRLPENLYVEGSPVLLEAGVLLKDNHTQKILAQMKFRNLSGKNLKGIRIHLGLFGIDGSVIYPDFEYSYLDINAVPDAEFGSRTPVFLPDNLVREMRFMGLCAFYSDGSSTVTENLEWTTLPAQELIQDHFQDPVLLQQWHLELGERSGFVPTKVMGLYRCTCGAINLKSAEKCIICKRPFAKMDELLTGTKLADLAAERIRLEEETAAAEREQRRIEEERIAQELREKEAEKKKRRKKRSIILAILFVFLCLLSVGMYFWGVPLIRLIIAQSEIKKGNYQEAGNTIDELKPFLQKVEFANELVYQGAQSLFDQENYLGSAKTFEKKVEYKDCEELAKISYGDYTDEGKKLGDRFRFTFIDVNTMQVYCYKDGKTYTMRR